MHHDLIDKPVESQLIVAMDEAYIQRLCYNDKGYAIVITLALIVHTYDSYDRTKTNCLKNQQSITKLMILHYFLRLFMTKQKVL